MSATGRVFWKGSALIAGLALGALALLAALAPWLTPQDPDHIQVLLRFSPPGPDAWLGRDELGRDVLSRMISGAGVSMGVGILSALLTTLVGASIGALAGYKGGRVDALLMRLADVLMCVPTLYLVLTLIALLGPGISNVVLVIVLTGWTGMARLVRAEVLALRERDFVLAARAAGAGPLSVLARHVLPNAMAPIYVALTFGVAGAILMESSLSFLGLGVQAPQSSWGSLLNSGRQAIGQAWWLTVFPGLMIFCVMLLVNHLGEQARQHFDPKAAA